MAYSQIKNVGFKTSFALLWAMCFVLHIFTVNALGFDLKTSFIDASLFFAVISAECWLVSRSLAYYLPENSKLYVIIGWSFTLAVLSNIFIYFIAPLINNQEQAYLQYLNSSFFIKLAFSFLLIGWISLICVFWYDKQEEEKLEERRRETEKLNKEAELTSLREKLQPHFLFNSLNSISSLTFSQPEQARKMIQQLSDFLRGTIKKDDQLTRLSQEIQHLGLYLDIEKVRFGSRLNTNVSCPCEIEEFYIPNMILQPIVENAIKFGLYNTLEEIEISVTCILEDDFLVIETRNPFDPETSPPKKGLGYGLENVKRRLFLLYNRNNLLKTDTKNNIFITRILIPIP